MSYPIIATIILVKIATVFVVDIVLVTPFLQGYFMAFRHSSCIYVTEKPVLASLTKSQVASDLETVVYIFRLKKNVRTKEGCEIYIG